MSTAAVTSSSIYQELQTFYQSRQSDVKQLGSDLKSGNLNAAQQDYSALVALGQNGPFANSEAYGGTTRAQAFTAIGTALEAGDLAGAQAAFATLTAPAATKSTTTTTATADTVNIASALSTASNSNTSGSGVTSVGPAPVTATAASATSIYDQLLAYRQQRAADLTQLGSDLQAGNLSAAQTDFNTLTALGQTGPNKNGQTFSNADRNQDFQVIGQALQSGNLALAQSAFNTLTNRQAESQSAQTAISAYNSNTNPVEIVINLGGASKAAADNATSGTTNSTANAGTSPEVVINLGETNVNGTAAAPAAPELVINLEAPSSAGASSNPVSATPELIVNLGGGGGSSSNTGPTGLTIDFSGAEILIEPTQTTSASTQTASTEAASTSTASATSSSTQTTSSSDSSATSFSQPQTGSLNQPVTLNLNPLDNYTLTLLNSTFTLTQSQPTSALSVSA